MFHVSFNRANCKKHSGTNDCDGYYIRYNCAQVARFLITSLAVRTVIHSLVFPLHRRECSSNRRTSYLILSALSIALVFALYRRECISLELPSNFMISALSIAFVSPLYRRECICLRLPTDEHRILFFSSTLVI